MIAIGSDSGRLLRTISSLGEKGITYGYHQRFGLVSEKTAIAREQTRKSFGLNKCRHGNAVWDCRFRIEPVENGSWQVSGVENCEVSRDEDIWRITTPQRQFQLSGEEGFFAPLAMDTEGESTSQRRVIPVASLSLTMFLLAIIFFPRTEQTVAEKEEKVEPVIVKVVKPKRAVTVPVPRTLKGIKRFTKKGGKETRVRRAIAQNLGFLGVLGEKHLRKALGGTPSRLKDASPGAGPGGGKGGSGGEMLVGLGKGIRKTTVGNTGTVGLGGIGTKGKGGGLGGYGNAVVSSGVGAAGLSNISLGNEVVMEGGLSQSVIEATIVKYLAPGQGLL